MDAPNPFAKSGPALAEIKVDHYNLNQALSKDDATNKPEKQSASQVAKPDESKSDESKPHDPLNEILVQNVKSNLELKKSYSEVDKAARIKKILLSGGMDSQQAAKALIQILEATE